MQSHYLITCINADLLIIVHLGTNFINTWIKTPHFLFKKSNWKQSTKCRLFCLCINSLALGRFEWNFKQVIFKLILVIDDWDISCEIALRGFSLDLTDDKSTLVQVMAWCHQATSHYLSQCWPKSMSPYNVTRPQWVNELPVNILQLMDVNTTQDPELQ